MAIYYDEITITKLNADSPSTVKGVLSNQRHIVPANLDGVVQSYSGASSSLKIYEGSNETTGNWSFEVSASSGVSATISGNTATLTSMSVDSGYIDIIASRSGYASITKRFELIKSRSDTNAPTMLRGTVTLAQPTELTSWSSAEANAALANAGYGAPINRDIVTLHNDAQKFSVTRFYDNGAWLDLDAHMSGNMLIDGTVSGAKISANSIVADLIVSKSCSSFESGFELRGNGTAQFPFFMDHAGVVTVIGTVNFSTSGEPNLDTDMSMKIDATGQTIGYASPDVTQYSITLYRTQVLQPGPHTVFLTASNARQEPNQPLHGFFATILKSYR